MAAPLGEQKTEWRQAEAGEDAVRWKRGETGETTNGSFELVQEENIAKNLPKARDNNFVSKTSQNEQLFCIMIFPKGWLSSHLYKLFSR